MKAGGDHFQVMKIGAPDHVSEKRRGHALLRLDVIDASLRQRVDGGRDLLAIRHDRRDPAPATARARRHLPHQYVPGVEQPRRRLPATLDLRAKACRFAQLDRSTDVAHPSNAVREQQLEKRIAVFDRLQRVRVVVPQPGDQELSAPVDHDRVPRVPRPLRHRHDAIARNRHSHPMSRLRTLHVDDGDIANDERPELRRAVPCGNSRRRPDNHKKKQKRSHGEPPRFPHHLPTRLQTCRADCRAMRAAN